jgi:hypothetical protein
MGCCDDGPKGWQKAVASEELCFRFVRVHVLTYMDDEVIPPGDYVVRCPALDLAFRVKSEDFEKYFEPLMQEQA